MSYRSLGVVVNTGGTCAQSGCGAKDAAAISSLLTRVALPAGGVEDDNLSSLARSFLKRTVPVLDGVRQRLREESGVSQFDGSEALSKAIMAVRDQTEVVRQHYDRVEIIILIWS